MAISNVHSAWDETLAESESDRDEQLNEQCLCCGVRVADHYAKPRWVGSKLIADWAPCSQVSR